MVVPNRVFDFLLFGLLAVAIVLDTIFGSRLHGVVTLLIVGGATYLAAQELSQMMGRRNWWTQESLATSLALSAMGFLYYWRRNDADVVEVVLSISFMMASLMALIALVSSFGAAIHARSGAPVAGLIVTAFAALVLGAMAGALVLVLTSTNLPIALRLGLLAVGLIMAKIRESTLRKGFEKPVNAAPGAIAATSTRLPEGMSAGGWMLSPERGTLLDRFLPVLLVGALALMVLTQTPYAASWTNARVEAAPHTEPATQP